LSEVTLTIGGEGIASFAYRLMDPYVLLFGAEIRPTMEVLCRFYVLHVMLGVIVFLVAFMHGIDLHSDHKIDDYIKSGLKVQII